MAKSIFTVQHKSFIEALREIRRASSMTQVELSGLLEKDQSYISNIERGQRRLDVIEFIAIAAALYRDAVELFGEIVTRMGDENSEGKEGNLNIGKIGRESWGERGWQAR